MTTKTDRLIVELDADNARLRQKLGESNKDINLFGKKAVKSMDTFKTAAIAALGVFSVTKIAGAVKGALDFADSIDKSAKAAGVGAQFLQEMRFAGDQTGISMIGLDDSMRRFNRRLGEFINSGGGPALAAFKSLNIAVRDIEGNVRSTEDVFADAVRGMNTLETTAQRSAVAAQLFGDDFGPKLVTLLDRGVEGIEALREAARETGQVMTDEMVQSAVDAKDAMTKLEFAATGLWNQLVVNLSPALEGTADWMSAFLKSMNGVPGSIAEIDAAIERLLKTPLTPTGFTPAGAGVEELRKNLLRRLTGSSDPEELERAAAIIREKIKDITREFTTPATQFVIPGLGIVGGGDPTTDRVEQFNQELQALVEKRKNILTRLRDLSADTGKGLGAGDKIAAEKEQAATKKEAERALKRQLAMEKASEKFLERRTSELQKGSDALVRSLDTDLEAENRRYKEGIEALKQFRDEEIEIEGGYLIVKQKLEDDHASRIKKINKDMADDGKDTFAELTSAVNGWGRDFADNLLDAEGDFGDFADSVVRQLARIAIANATQPAFDAFGNFISSTISSFIPGFAHGTRSAPGGLAIVGERGPEVVNLPRGSQVIPNNRLGGGDVNVYQSFDFTGANPATVQLLRQEARNIRENTIGAIRDMKARGDLPEFA